MPEPYNRDGTFRLLSFCFMLLGVAMSLDVCRRKHASHAQRTLISPDSYTAKVNNYGSPPGAAERMPHECCICYGYVYACMLCVLSAYTHVSAKIHLHVHVHVFY